MNVYVSQGVMTGNKLRSRILSVTHLQDKRFLGCLGARNTKKFFILSTGSKVEDEGRPTPLLFCKSVQWKIRPVTNSFQELANLNSKFPWGCEY